MAESELEVISIDDEDCQRLIAELRSSQAAVRKARELSEQSFRDWFLDMLQAVAKAMGYVIVGIRETAIDIGYAARSGWREGAEEARRRSYRAKKGDGLVD